VNRVAPTKPPSPAKKTPAAKKAAPATVVSPGSAGPASKKESARLNDKQLRFVQEYLIDLNASQAAIRAGYSARTAGSQAHDLLKKPEIQQAISEARIRTSQRLELTRDMVIEQYRRIGFSDVRKFFDENGQLKPITKLDDETAAALQGFEVELRQLDGADAPPVPVLKVKWADRKTALDSLMRAQGWNSAEQHEITGKNGKPIEHAVRVVLVPPKQTAQVDTRPIKKGED
jgi:phage terminase small subunit